MSFKKRLNEIDARKAELRKSLEAVKIEDVATFDVKPISDEIETLTTEERRIMDIVELSQKVQSSDTLLTNVGDESRGGFMGQGGLSAAEYAMTEARKSKEYRYAFFKMLQSGKGTLTAEERKIMHAGNEVGNGRNLTELRFTSDSGSAGAAIPQITLDLVVQKLLVVSAVYPFISKYNLKGNLKIPYENVFGDAAWTAEGSTVAPGADTLAFLLLTAYDLIKTVQVSRVVEQLSIDAFEAYIVDKLFRKLMVAIENAIINGTGTTQPTGILPGISWILAPGATQNKIHYGATLSTLTYTNFTTLKGLLKAPYHPNAYFVMNSNTLYSGVCGIKDALGRPIFLENPQWGLTTPAGDGKQVDYNQSAIVGRILGSPVIMSPYVADGTILLGDLRFYNFNLSVDVLIEKSYEYGFAQNDVWYKGWLLADGGVSIQEAFVQMTINSL